MWDNRNVYNGLSVLPMDLGTYIQAPYEDCDAGTYERMLSLVKNVDLDLVKEVTDETDLSGEIACGGGGCEIF